MCVSEEMRTVNFTNILVFMVVSLKKSIPFVIKSFPKTKIDGTWLSSQITECIECHSGFVVRVVVSDSHSINAFSVLKKEYASIPSHLLISYHPYVAIQYPAVPYVHMLTYSTLQYPTSIC